MSALKKYLLHNKHHPSNKNSKLSNKSQSKTQSPPHKTSIVTLKPIKTQPLEEFPQYLQDKDLENKSTIKHKSRTYSLNPPAFPSIQKSIKLKEQKMLNEVYHKKIPNNHNRYEIQGVKKLQPIRLMKPLSFSHSASYLSLSSSRNKLTDRYFSHMDNIKLVERLLLVRPSKDTSRGEHQEFFKQQERYKRNIQISKSLPFKSKKNSKPWINL